MTGVVGEESLNGRRGDCEQCHQTEQTAELGSETAKRKPRVMADPIDTESRSLTTSWGPITKRTAMRAM